MFNSSSLHELQFLTLLFYIRYICEEGDSQTLNSMQQPFLKAISCSLTQKCPLLVPPIQNQMTPVHSFPSYTLDRRLSGSVGTYDTLNENI